MSYYPDISSGSTRSSVNLVTPVPKEANISATPRGHYPLALMMMREIHFHHSAISSPVHIYINLFLVDSTPTPALQRIHAPHFLYHNSNPSFNPMADTKESSTPVVEKTASIGHDEFAGTIETPELATADITYDRNGIKGILRSPFVCGAAMLASFGGFSFGYGTSRHARSAILYNLHIPHAQIKASSL